MTKDLNFELYGESKGKNTLLIAHGLFGSSKNWKSIARRISETGRQVVIVDMRNHGLSFWSDNHGYKDMAQDLIRVINMFGGCVDLIGHSMGGKAAMALALMYPSHIGKLIVVDISPVKYTHNQSDYITAMEAVDLSVIENRKDVDTQLSRYVKDVRLRTFFTQSIDFSQIPLIKWRINLKAIKKNIDQIMSFPNFNTKRLRPTLFLRGSISEYISNSNLGAIKNYFPSFQLVTVVGASHWVHAENPNAFYESVMEFLQEGI